MTMTFDLPLREAWGIIWAALKAACRRDGKIMIVVHAQRIRVIDETQPEDKA